MKFPAACLLAATAAITPQGPQTFLLKAVPGQTLRTTIEAEEDQEMLSSTFVVDGEEMSDEAEMSISFQTKHLVSFDDQVQEAQEGAASRMLRTFTAIEGSVDLVQEFDGESMEESMTLVSDLVDLELPLQREGAGAEWALEPEDRDRLLGDYPGHRHMDFFHGELLPAGPVEIDESWSIPAEWILKLDSPCGELGLYLEDSEFDPEVDGETSVEGEVEVTFRGLREEDGISLAVLELEIDVVISTEHADEENTAVERGLAGVGTALWNLEGGRLHSASLELEAEDSMESAWTDEDEGETYEIESRETFGGSLAIELRVELIE